LLLYNKDMQLLVLDSMLGDKASINPSAIATSDGPVDPQNEESSSLSLTLPTTSCSEVKSKYLNLCIS